jgi:hypothetical protein
MSRSTVTVWSDLSAVKASDHVSSAQTFILNRNFSDEEAGRKLRIKQANARGSCEVQERGKL